MQNRIPCESIDVGFIIFNERDILGPTLDALLSAGFDSFVILDMGSTDGTVELVREKLGVKAKILNFPRRSLIEFGYGEARNTCALFGTREWLLFVDADEVLINGAQSGFVEIDSVGLNSSLLSVERRNLAYDRVSGDEKIIVKSVEFHNRLYRPGFGLRYKGYIHEEIHVENVSGWRDNGTTNLVFDHYSSLKSNFDAEAKSDLYGFMLIRAFNQPTLRVGTNPWWYEHHVPTNKASLLARAQSFAKRAGLSAASYGPLAVPTERKEMSNFALRPVVAVDQEEVEFEIGNLRKLHSASCARWTGKSDRVVWSEWNHPGEGSRKLTTMIETAKSWRWDRYIVPGKVAIDIGGHSGDTAIPMGLFAFDKTTGQKGTIVVIEPNPAVLPVMNVNLTLNTHVADFFTLEAAVTDVDMAEIELADHGNSQCNGGILNNNRLSPEARKKILDSAMVRYKAIGISMETLFEQIKKYVSEQPIGFIKIDCEGYDKEILKPCRELLQKDKPVLFVEWFDWFGLEDDTDFFAAIDAIDYLPFEPLTMKPASPSHRVADVICLHRDSVDVSSNFVHSQQV